MQIQWASISFSTVTRLSTDPCHMLHLQKGDPHTTITLTCPETYILAIGWGDPAEIPHNRTVAPRHDCTLHTKLYILHIHPHIYVCVCVFMGKGQAHVPCTLVSVKQEELWSDRLCLYWHNVWSQLSLITAWIEITLSQRHYICTLCLVIYCLLHVRWLDVHWRGVRALFHHHKPHTFQNISMVIFYVLVNKSHEETTTNNKSFKLAGVDLCDVLDPWPGH